LSRFLRVPLPAVVSSFFGDSSDVPLIPGLVAKDGLFLEDEDESSFRTDFDRMGVVELGTARRGVRGGVITVLLTADFGGTARGVKVLFGVGRLVLVVVLVFFKTGGVVKVLFGVGRLVLVLFFFKTELEFDKGVRRGGGGEGCRIGVRLAFVFFSLVVDIAVGRGDTKLAVATGVVVFVVDDTTRKVEVLLVEVVERNGVVRTRKGVTAGLELVVELERCKSRC
jgi:hypothetical protein